MILPQTMAAASWPAWLRRSAAIALLMLAVYLPVHLLVLPILGWLGDFEARRLELENRLAHHENQVAQMPGLQKRLETLQARVDPAALFWSADTADLAAAAIQVQVSQIAVAHQAQVVTLQTSPPVTEQGFEKLSVQLEFTTTLTSLQQLLFELEHHNPALFLRNLSITAQSAVNTDGQLPAEPLLLVRADISGLRLP